MISKKDFCGQDQISHSVNNGHKDIVLPKTYIFTKKLSLVQNHRWNNIKIATLVIHETITTFKSCKIWYCNLPNVITKQVDRYRFCMSAKLCNNLYAMGYDTIAFIAGK